MWWVGRAGGAWWRAYQKSRSQPGGPWTFAAVLFCVWPMTVIWMLAALAQHHGTLFWELLGANALMAALLAVAPLARNAASSRVLDKYASPPRQRDEAALMRERADLLAELAEQRRVMAARLAPPALPPAEPEDDDGLTSRLLSLECPDTELGCAAPPGIACAPGIGIPVALVRRRPVEFCHIARMREAIDAGAVTEDEVVSRFTLLPL